MFISKISTFLGNASGNMAILFSLAAVPMMIGSGAAVDMVRSNDIHAALQTAADSAALAGAVSGKSDEKSLKAIVTNYLEAQGVNELGIVDLTVTPKHNATERRFSVEIHGKMKTGFMFLAGVKEMNVGAFAEVALGGMGLEVVMALDNTASMNSGARLPALKTAAKSLVDTVLDGSSASGTYVKIGIVPFANYVNVGMSNRSASWMEVAPDTSETRYDCWNDYPDATKSNCRMETYTGYNDGVPHTYETEVCDWDAGTPVEHCATNTYTYNWQGCVGSRSAPLDTEIVGLGDRYPGVIRDTWGNSIYCPVEILPLSDSKAVLNAKIDAMEGGGNTYIATGVLWAWNMLDSEAPLAGAKTSKWMKDNGGTKALVLMTDGDNTLSPTYPLHDGSDAIIANKVTAEACVNAKKEDIVIYTVAFMVTNPAALDMLKKCASDPSKAFTADDSSALNNAFNDIASTLLATRLTQ